jgi:hypothetical protein
VAGRGRICRLCMDEALLKRANSLIAQGNLSDQKIADMLGFPGGAGRILVYRHRKVHVEAPALAIATAANRGRANVDKREKLVAAASAGDDGTAFVGLEEITRDARGISKDLKKARKATKNAGQFSVMSGIVAQEHNNLNLRGKLGGHVGFIPQKLTPGEAGVPFNLTVNLGGQSKTLSFTPAENVPDPGMMIEAQPVAVAIPAPPDVGDPVGDIDEEMDKILSCVFDKKPDTAEEVEPAPA